MNMDYIFPDALIIASYHARNVESYLRAVSKKEFLKNPKLKSAIKYELIKFGRSLKGLSRGYKTSFSKVPWDDIIGMSDKLAHIHDFLINDEILYESVTEGIQDFVKYKDRILAFKVFVELDYNLNLSVKSLNEKFSSYEVVFTYGTGKFRESRYEQLDDIRASYLCYIEKYS